MTKPGAHRATTPYPVMLTLPDGQRSSVEMSDRDLAVLNHVAAGEHEVKTVKEFGRLASKGLVKHKFITGDWTRAVVVVTELGQAALRLGQTNRIKRRRTMREPGWTPDETERLRQGWLANKTQGTLAREFRRSTSSIVGKVARMRQQEGAERWPERGSPIHPRGLPKRARPIGRAATLPSLSSLR